MVSSPTSQCSSLWCRRNTRSNLIDGRFDILLQVCNAFLPSKVLVAEALLFLYFEVSDAFRLIPGPKMGELSEYLMNFLMKRIVSLLTPCNFVVLSA